MRDMSADDVFRIYDQLKATGRLREIFDDDGRIEPSTTALNRIEETHPNAEPAEKWHLAQCRTLMDLAKKYESELN